jgi:capsular polysaccharide biosynthesis protein
MTEQQKAQHADGASLPASARMIDLMDLVYHLAAGWKFIVCAALICAVIAGVYTVYFVTPLYRATSILYVLSPESVLNISSLQLGTALTSDYIKVFDMWEVHEAVIDNLNLDSTYAQMRENLTVTNSTGTRMLDISFTSPSPAEAAAIANEYAKVAREFIAATMDTAQPNIFEEAWLPTAPSSPNRTRNILLGAIVGIVIACAIIFIQFIQDDKIRTADDVQKYVDLPTLGMMPLRGSKNPQAKESYASHAKK